MKKNLKNRISFISRILFSGLLLAVVSTSFISCEKANEPDDYDEAYWMPKVESSEKIVDNIQLNIIEDEN